jgi:hypothetical protein
MKSMMPKTKLIRDFLRLANKADVASGNGDPSNETPHSYSKLEYHRLGKRVLKTIADELGLQSGTYDIRSNLGGPAVSGEITLHTDHVYIQFSNGVMGDRFMARSCKGRKDYTGGANIWIKYDKLLNLPEVCKTFQIIIRNERG